MYDLLAQERANKAALILASQRYTMRFAPFVKDSKSRLAYVEAQLDEMLAHVADETQADFDYLKNRFDQFIAETVLDPSNDNNHQELQYQTQGESFPVERNEEGDPLEGEVVKDDVQNLGDVDGAGDAEAVQSDAKEDLADYSKDGPGASEIDEGPISQRSNVVTAGKTDSCVRCGKALNAIIAKRTVVCPDCTASLKKKALDDFDLGSGDNTQYNDQSTDYLQDSVPGQDLPFRCKICGEPGSQQDVAAHVQQAHPEAIQAKYDEMMGNQPQNPEAPQPMAAAKEADVPDAQDPDRAEVQPLPETPADRFDDTIQDLANRAAARQFSAPSDQEIQTISSQLGLNPGEVRQALYAAAIFGNYTAINGQLGGQAQAPEGYEEVSLQGLGGSVNSHEALVPVDLVVNKVADSMNMEPNLVYQQVRDKYGDDLPDKYHASVSGETHYYLPTEMAGNQQAQQQQPAYDPTVGPTAPPAPQPVPTA